MTSSAHDSPAPEPSSRRGHPPGTGAMLSALALLTGLAVTPAWSEKSPAGEILYFEEIRPGKGQLMLLDVASGEKRPVGRSGSRPDHYPSWSADGHRIAFESYRRGGWHVWVSEADGSAARRLTDLPDYDTSAYEFDPSFAPDGETVIFSQGGDLFTVKLDDPTPVRLTPPANGISEKAAVFSPDGRQVVFVGYRRAETSRHVHLMSSDGGEARPLTSGTSRNLAPMWSPDGETILFYSDREGSFELYEMRADGADPRPLMSAAQRERAGFTEVAFVEPFDNDWGATQQYRASYSPDGRWVVFSREIDGDRELFVVRRDGEGLKRLTRREGLDGMPMWRPKVR